MSIYEDHFNCGGPCQSNMAKRPKQAHWTLAIDGKVLPVYGFGTSYWSPPDAPLDSSPGILSNITLKIHGVPENAMASPSGFRATLRGYDGTESPGRAEVVTASHENGRTWDVELNFRPDSWTELRGRL